MAADDSLFEKALARQMRDDQMTNGESVLRQASTPPHKLCPDVEIVAAYHERSLAGDEMILCKEHLVSCARCQEVLAQLEATEDILVTIDEKDQVPAVYEDAGASVTMPASAVFAARSSAMEELRPLAARTSSTPISATGQVAATVNKGRRNFGYWLVPAGAIAAALLVWVGMHPQSRNIFSKTQLQTAENRQAPLPKEAFPAYGSANTEKNGVATAKPEGRVSPAVSEPRAFARKKSPAKEPSLVLPKGSAAVGGAVAGNADAGAARTYTNATTQSVEVSSGDAPVSQPQTSGANIAPLATGQELQTAQMPAPLPSSSVPQSAQKKAAQAPDSAAASAVMSRQAGAVAKASANFGAVSDMQNPRLIPAPGGNIVWRVGITGLIEQSANAGAIWLPQNSGVTVTLDSGSAPTEAVCWIVGRAGTILQTVDGGAHWSKLVSPLSTDLGGIHAADAQHATVWDVAKRNSFATADGGVTWTRVPNE